MYVKTIAEGCDVFREAFLLEFLCFALSEIKSSEIITDGLGKDLRLR